MSSKIIQQIGARLIWYFYSSHTITPMIKLYLWTMW
jgi:hypothetical protein